MAAHAREARPEECCGILVGRAGEIVDAIRSPNRADDPLRRYLLDPAVHIGARRDARSAGLAVLGFYHSHPDSPPTPSATDRENASYEDHLYAIVRPLPAGCDARLFRLTTEGFVEETMVTVDDVDRQSR